MRALGHPLFRCCLLTVNAQYLTSCVSGNEYGTGFMEFLCFLCFSTEFECSTHPHAFWTRMCHGAQPVTTGPTEFLRTAFPIISHLSPYLCLMHKS